jgi:AcrR family transcriptional regulator
MPKKKHEIRKDELCDKALKVFARYGYRKTTLDDIAKEAKVSKGTIYNYFKDKDDIYQQAITQAGTKWQIWVKDSIKGKNSSLDIFHTLFKEATLYLSSNPEFQKVLRDNPRNFPLFTDSPFRELEINAKILFRSVLEKGVETGDFRPMDFDKMEKVIYSIYRMFIVWKYIIPNEFFDDSLIDSVADLIIDGIGSKTHRSN